MNAVNGLENHPVLKQDMEQLEQNLADYAGHRGGYEDVAAGFRDTVRYLVGELVKIHPGCKGGDDRMQISKLHQSRYLTRKQADTLLAAVQAGYTDKDTGQDLTAVYDGLCQFLPTFINWVPAPDQEPKPESSYRRTFNGYNNFTILVAVFFVIVILIMSIGASVSKSIEDAVEAKTEQVEAEEVETEEAEPGEEEAF